MNAPFAADAGMRDLIDTRLTAPGIRCAGCIGKIERELPKLDGIESARVNFSAKRVAIRHSRALDESDLVDALAHIGFEAQPVAANPLAQDDRETKALLRALAVAGFGMMNIMLLSVSVWAGAQGSTRELFHWLSAIIALPVIAYAGRPFFSSAWMAMKYRRTNMDVPISIGIALATGLSLYETLDGGQHAYFDGAVMLLFFLLAGRALDATMRSRTRAGIGAVLSKMGRSAAVIQPDDTTKRLNVEQLAPDMLMLVAAGEALAADGEIVSGTSAIDNSMLTGESTPIAVGAHDKVFAGAINQMGSLTVRITAVAKDTALAEIARLMDEAGQSRSHYVKIADRAARLYAPLVHSLALAAFIGWILAGAGWHQALVIAISVLIITCPCAMGLAVPAAQVVAAGALGKRGLLIKDGTALERLADIDIALFDKTGTLTMGEPQAELDDLPPDAKAVALGLAQASRHPLSRAITKALLADHFVPATLDEIKEHPGQGIAAKYLGSSVFLERDPDAPTGLASRLTIGEKSWGIRYADHVRPDAAGTLRMLGAMGIESRILSGDREQMVAAVAEELDSTGEGGATPARKLAVLEALKKYGHHPLMVGDGLNDGPALAAAHASIAPGNASDISQQAADAVFVGDRLMPVALGIKVARRTMSVVRQNFALAVFYNICAVPLALGGVVTPLIAAVAMSLSSLIVVGNSLRLARAAR